MTNQELVDSLAKTSKDLMLKEPFYGLFLIMLQRKFNTKVETAGVYINGITYNLEISPEFWKILSSDHRKGLLKHELLHIAFFHLTNYEGLRDNKIRNIAMDLEINQYIDEEWLPVGGMVLSLFPELNLEKKKGTHYYYDELMKAAKDKSCPNLNSMLESQGTTVILSEGNGNTTEVNLPQHNWENKDGKPMDEATKKLLNKHSQTLLNEIKAQIEKSKGTIPGEISNILDEINYTEPPKFDWRGYLRRFAGGNIKTYTKKTRRKFNKRYEDNPGLKIKYKKHVLVGIDTSGSVSNDELTEFMQEIHHIFKTGAEITIAHADAAIQKIEKYNPKAEKKIYGRGGTSFDPVIDYYAENNKKYSCLIYLTDGEAPAPSTKANKVLWVLSSKSKETDHLPGVTIKLN